MYIYFFKITVAYILPDFPLQPAMVLVYLFQKAYILAKLSHIFNFFRMKLSCDLIYVASTIDLNILYCILYLFMLWFNGAHNVGYLCISIFFCNPNHIKTAVESTMLCVCFCKNVVEMCCRYEFLCIYFFKNRNCIHFTRFATAARNGYSVFFSESVYIGQVVSHI